MPRYVLLIYEAEAERASLGEEEDARFVEGYRAFIAEASRAGVLRGGDRLGPTATATTVRVREQGPLFTDGPFAETKEQLGGYFVLDCASLDDALTWASRVPSARIGSVEVRPVAEMPAAP
ncbi:MAG TPA: YciI family protein [Actinomycetota bacterium]|nr:YciI family protein [Actinomycetota bacterium]